ncbi:MAG: polysaccharide biosynthesis protein [Segniliparus sp.]|uniref:polysaccharide biosynthesis protein n=1 Tax=Segniliparus sp. TaxID=2804064 RepID=UPI003F3A16A3
MSAQRPAVLNVGLATAFSAASGYLVLLLAARSLTEAAYTGWFVFWSAFGLATGALNGVLQESARAVRARTAAAPERRSPALSPPRAPSPLPSARRLLPPWISSAWSPEEPARPLVAGIGVGVLAGGAALVTAPLWAGALFVDAGSSGGALPLAGLFAISVCSVAVQAAVGGLLSAAYAWKPFAALTVLDAAFRLAVAVACARLGAGPGWFSVAAVAGAGSWLVLLAASKRSRSLANARADVPMREFLRRAGAAIAAAAASAVLVMGFPVLLKITTPGRLPEGAGALLLAVTLTRAPLLVPLNVFQGALVAWCTDRRDRPWRALGAAAAAVLAVGTVCAAAAAMLGPWLLAAVFHVAWPFGRPMMAALTFGAAMIALLTCTGVSCLTTGRSRTNAVGWWAATIAALALLLVPALPQERIDLRVCLALIVGPLVGMAVHLGALRRM